MLVRLGEGEVAIFREFLEKNIMNTCNCIYPVAMTYLWLWQRQGWRTAEIKGFLNTLFRRKITFSVHPFACLSVGSFLLCQLARWSCIIAPYRTCSMNNLIIYFKCVNCLLTILLSLVLLLSIKIKASNYWKPIITTISKYTKITIRKRSLITMQKAQSLNGQFFFALWGTI